MIKAEKNGEEREKRQKKKGRNLDVSVVPEQQIARLDVPVDHLLVVYCAHRSPSLEL